MTIILPATVELCIRNRDGHPCLGVIYRPQPDVIYCPKCGGTDAGVIYVRQEADAR